VRLKGKRVRTAHLEVRFIASLLRSTRRAPSGVPKAAGKHQTPGARAGIIVPKYSHSSVERNLVKRRLREIVRQDVLPSLRPVDVVVRALPSAYRASFSELRAQCRRACERAGLLAVAGAASDPTADAG
jgi:ribonuclease P protein component